FILEYSTKIHSPINQKIITTIIFTNQSPKYFCPQSPPQIIKTLTPQLKMKPYPQSLTLN
ncbi:hypothetical protein Leryth_006053, partial [Lithospermum erythrorhizon]